MDADGNVLARHEPGEDRGVFRTTAGFRQTVAIATEMRTKLDQLEAAAKKGDVAAAEELLAIQIDLMHLDPATAKARLAKMTSIADDQRAVLDAKILAAEVNAIQSAVTEDVDTQIAAGKQFAEMIAAGRVPNEADALYFWYFTSKYAEKAGKADLFEKSIAGLAKQGKRIPPAMIAQMRKTLADMRAKQ